jgi:hypothetical protein
VDDLCRMECRHSRPSHRDFRFDMGVRLVAFEREILVTEREQVGDGRIEAHSGQYAQRTRELQLSLLHVVKVKVSKA